jgi:hypothetical protein
MENATLVAALWGLAGAFMYAAPKMSACVFSAKPEDGPPMRCVIDAIIALVIGALAAAAFAEFAQDFLKRTEPGARSAIAAVIGLLANPLAPRLIGRLSSWLLKKAPGQ